MMLHRRVSHVVACTFFMGMFACSGPDDTEDMTDMGTTDMAPSNNLPPIAEPGDNFNAFVGDRVEVTAAESSDPENAPLTVKWTLLGPEGSTATLEDPLSFRTAFTPDIEGIYKLTLVVNDGVQDSAPDNVYVKVYPKNTPQNQAPSANAGPDATYFLDQQVLLDGSQSSDPEGSALTYTWRLVSAPEQSDAALMMDQSSKAELVTTVPGDYEVELVVNDGELDSAPDTVTLTLKGTTPTNTPPIAVAGESRSAAIGEKVFLDGAGSSDPDGDPITYAWSLVSAPTGSVAMIEDGSLPLATFTPDVGGDYVIELVVSDGEAMSAPSQLTLTVSDEPNQIPVAVSQARYSVQLGQSATLDGSASYDDDGDTLTYRWKLLSKPAGSVVLLQSATSAKATLTPDVEGDYVVELTVNDGIASSTPIQVTVTASTLPPYCFIFSEYIEGSGNNKALELFNCGPDSLDLTGIYLCMSNNNDTTCATKLPLTGTLAAGEVIGVCHGSVDMSKVDAGDCDYITSSGVAQFNGDDRFVIYLDSNQSATFDAGDIILDAFGETSVFPSSKLWEDVTYRRCDFTPYDGFTPFDVASLYDEALSDDFSDFGIPPSMSAMCGGAVGNRAPTAKTGASRTVTTGQPVTLDGSGSTDPDMDVLSYAWTLTQAPAGSTAMLNDATLARPSFTPDLDGAYTFELVVSDGQVSSAAATVTLTAQAAGMPGAGCLLISEYVEGSASNKAIELYNCSSTEAVNLGEVNLCLISNDGTSCNATAQLTGQLQPGAVLGLCNSGAGFASDTTKCQVTTFNSVINFSGDDRLILYRDVNDDGALDAQDAILDAFGQSVIRPPGAPWNDKTFRRCNATPYDGLGAFDVLTYYSDAGMVNDTSHLGVAPTLSGCP